MIPLDAPNDLASRLCSAIQERRRLAEAATRGEWFVFADPVDPEIGDMYWVHSRTHGGVTHDLSETSPCGVGIERTEHEGGRADANFIAALSPAVVLRQVERDERALERHSPDPEGTCWHGDWAEIWPCIEVRELAASYAIPTEDPQP